MPCMGNGQVALGYVCVLVCKPRALALALLPCFTYLRAFLSLRYLLALRTCVSCCTNEVQVTVLAGTAALSTSCSAPPCWWCR
jgi:hypothetical protein